MLITGIIAAGSSTISHTLTKGLLKRVHLRDDVFHRMIVGGRAEMDFELSLEAHNHLRLRYRITATVADLCVRAGFTVVYQDMIIDQALVNVVQSYQEHAVYAIVSVLRQAWLRHAMRRREKPAITT